MSFTKQEILSTLDQLNIQYDDQSGEWIKLKCINPIHNDSDPSAGIHSTTGNYNCFGCTYKTNIVGIVTEYLNCSIKDAYSFIRGKEKNKLFFTTHKISNQSLKQEKEERKNNNITFSQKDLITTNFNPEDYKYTRQRGFTNEFCNHFNIMHCLSNPYSDYFVLPIIDSSKEIMTFEARKLMQYEKLLDWYTDVDWNGLNGIITPEKQFDLDCKYYNWKYKKGKLFENDKEIFNSKLEYLMKRKVLYPIHSNINQTIFNIDFLDRKAPLYIVEGIGSVAKIWTHISKNVTCTFGSQISKSQLDYLIQFKELIFIPDDDVAGYEMIKKLAKNLKFNVLDITVDDTDDNYVSLIQNSKILSSIEYMNKKINFLEKIIQNT